MHQVGIFWDYENCPPPSNPCISALIDQINQVATIHGHVKEFNAYFDPTSASQKSRSDLRHAGVVAKDCPKTGQKDIVDKVIIVDMYEWAWEVHPKFDSTPATIVLIAGDGDYSYAVAKLKRRGLNIVIISDPLSTYAGLSAQAHHHQSWSVLRQASLQSSNQTLSQPSSLASFVSNHDLNINQSNSPQTHLFAPTFMPPFPTVAPSFPFSFPNPSRPAKLTAPFNHESDNQQHGWHSGQNASSPPPNIGAPSPLNSLSPTAATFSPKPSPFRSTSEGGAVARPHSMNEALSFSIERDTVIRGPLPVDESPHVIVPTPSLDVSSHEDSAVSLPYIDRGFGPSVAAEFALSTKKRPDEDTSHLRPSSVDEQAQHGRTPRPTSPVNLSMSESVPDGLPDAFSVLYRCLRTRLRNGQHRPLRSSIPNELSKIDPTLYDRLSLREPQFKTFISLAVDAGVVVVGGERRDAWISIHPKWLPNNTTSVSVACSPASRTSPDIPNIEVSSHGQTLEDGQTDAKSTSDVLESSHHSIGLPPSGSDWAAAINQLVKSDFAPSNGAHEHPSFGSQPLPNSPNAGPPVENSSPHSTRSDALATVHSTTSTRSYADMFAPLYECLLNHLKGDVSRPSRSDIANEFRAEGSSLYSRHGLQGFKDYVDRAKQVGLVIDGGSGRSDLWLAIHPDLVGVKVVFVAPDGKKMDKATTTTTTTSPTTNSPSSPSSSSSSSSSTATLVTPSITTTTTTHRRQVPNDYKPLVQILLSHLSRSKGDHHHQPLRADLARELESKDPTLYARVGVPGFAQYMARAEKARIVVLEGAGGTACVVLRSEWMTPMTTTTTRTGGAAALNGGGGGRNTASNTVGSNADAGGNKTTSSASIRHRRSDRR